MRFELYVGKGKKHYWRIRARNGRIIADSAEGYSRKCDAVKQINHIRANASSAETLSVPLKMHDPNVSWG